MIIPRSPRKIPEALSAFGLLFTLVACGDSKPDSHPAPASLPYDNLSEYGFFKGDLKEQAPEANVHRYEVAAALWSDNASKDRFIVLPEGQKIGLTDREDWEMPEGSILIKTFRFPEDVADPDGPSQLIETRLLILEKGEWTGHTYVWNDAQEDAVRTVAGKVTTVTYVDAKGKKADHDYNIPNTNQCRDCHARDDKVHLLGTITPQLNFVPKGASQNQLVTLGSIFEKGAPNPAVLPAFAEPFGNGALENRARAYLGANCSHCHRPGGGAGDSGLTLLQWETEPRHYGVCKSPAAAGPGTGGHEHDIEPGKPDDSIMPFRMASTDPEIKMPELPNLLPDERGIALVRDWIASMKAGCP